jgi:DNA helicase II / ATP-dependent DNA helicase PcrA
MSALNLNELNKEQKQAVEKTRGAVLVTAGAGSGKTRVLTYRIAHLIEKGVKPYNILSVTFTNKAAAEMKERVVNLVNDSGANSVWLYTFHSMCVQILRQNRNIERFDNYTINFSIYDTTDRDRILKTLIAEEKIEGEDYLGKISWHISNAKNQNLSLEEYKQQISYYSDCKTIINLMAKYESRMNANNALDFDSLLTYTYKLLVNNPDILEYYQNKFEYIHIDEFQDTNTVQYDLVKLLSAKHKNVFVVGDEDQCIYTWRGANSSHIFKFTQDFEPVKLIKLEQNYRSTKKILDLANKVIKNNNSRLEKKLWTEKDDGVRVEYKTEFNERYEANFVAESVYNLARMNGYNYSDIAVLMRLNALTRHLEEKFLEYNIPYRVFGGMKFYDRAEIKNLLAYLKLIVNPKDASSFNRVINFPKRGIGQVALVNLKDNIEENESPLETVLNLDENSPISKGALTKFLEFKALMLNLIKKSSELPLSEFIEYVIDFAGVKEAYGSGKEEDINRLYNLSELISSVEEYEKNNKDAKLEEYLQSVSLTTDVDDYDQTKNLVTLATVHSVKGLEFKVVFIIGCEENIFPMKRKDSTDDDIEEERRLMYVAITRAGERLYITNARQRFLYGDIKYMQPSRFLKEAELIENKETNVTLTDEYGDKTTYKVPSKISDYSGVQVRETKAAKVSVKDIVTKLKVNDRVLHPKFGEGVVLSISGANYTKTASIHFEGMGTKILALNFAPLTIL